MILDGSATSALRLRESFEPASWLVDAIRLIGLYPELARADGMLRDWSPAAMAEEARVYASIRDGLDKLDPSKLTPPRRIDRDVALHQIDFMLHQYEDRKYWQRSLDTYVN